MKISGIYEISCKSTQKRYIGSSTRLNQRKATHFSHLRKGIHGNILLQNAFNKYGENDFAFKILAFCAPKETFLEEQKFLDFYKTYDKENGYNICTKAESCSGRVLTDEHKEKIRIGNLGKKNTKEAKERMSLAQKGNKNNLGKKLSEETKRKISLAHTGKKLSEKTKKLIGLVGRGRKASEKTKKKMSLRMIKYWREKKKECK